MAQKLDHFTMTAGIVLQEDKHIYSNAADHWHQRNFSLILPANFSVRLCENEIGISKFRYRSRGLTNLLKVGCMHRRRQALTLLCLIVNSAYIRSFL